MLLLTAAYLAAVNLGAFAAFAGDKSRAVRGLRRIPERALLRLALAGGSAGAIAAQQLLRHKTRKEPFRTRLRLIAAAHVLALAALAYIRARSA